jgi:purine-binding chemotaxis protein CheW
MTEAVTLSTEARTLLATFMVGEALFALDAAGVQEVIRVNTITPVPHAPAEVIGVINLRGKIVTLLDAGLILASAPALRSRESRIFLIEDKGEFIGLLVDQVGEVIESEPTQWESLPLNIPTAQARFFQGVCRSGGRVITLLNQVEILSGGRTKGPSDPY